jgi:dTDP-L-rhamnose 4-epimerase
VHVDDIVEALSRALKADLPNGMVINVGAGQPTSVRELAETLLAVSGLSVPIRVTGQFRIGDIRHCFADISRLEKHLGFKPQVALEQGLRKFTQWATTQPVYEDQSARATEELRRMGLSNDR